MQGLTVDHTSRARRPDREEPPHATRESLAWHEAYTSDQQSRRRRQALPGKLRGLGVDRAEPDEAILDLCCGHGEALDALWTLGFRRLSGLDITVSETLLSDSRFDVRRGDAKRTPWPDAAFDWILNIHAMHHLGLATDVERFLAECWRLLKPGGRLGIVDFSDSIPIRMAFWWFRQGYLQWTPYLKNFGRMIQEEWPFLKDYLPQFREVRKLLLDGRFVVERHRRGLFYFHLTLRKPE